VLLIYELLLIRINGLYYYLTKLSSYTKIITILTYLGSNTLLLYRDDPKHGCLNIYAMNVFVATVWFNMDLQITSVYRKLAFKLVAMTKNIASLSILLIVWIFCFAHIFYFTDFGLFHVEDLDVQSTYSMTAIKTYDILFNHWNDYIKTDYLTDKFAYFFFLASTVVLPLLVMRFIVALTTDT